MEKLSERQQVSPLVRFIEHLNANDVETALTLVDPDFTGEDLALKHVVKGLDDVRAQIAGWDVSNFKQTIVNVIDAGDAVAIEGIMAGIHKDPFPIGDQIYAPTGRKVAFRFCTVATIRAGRLLSETHYYDAEGLRAQLR